MTSYFIAFDVTGANSNHKIFLHFFDLDLSSPHFEKDSATHDSKSRVKNFSFLKILKFGYFRKWIFYRF